MQVSKRYIKYLFLLAPFLFSAAIYTQTNPSVANVLLALKLIAFLYISVDYLKSKQLSGFDFAMMAYFIIWFIAAYLNGSSIIDYIKEVVVISSFVFIIEDSFKQAKEGYLLRALGHLIFIELTINLICLIVFPEGLWRTYSIYGDEAVYSFLGLDNQVTPIFIVSELVIFIRLYFDDFKISIFSVIYVVVLAGNILLTGSATGIMGCVIVPLMLILGVRYRKFINIKTVLIVVISVFVLVVLLRLQNIFAFIIEGLFNKDLTLTNRIGIWDKALEMIKQKPLIGYGCGTLATIIGDRNAHDFYLQIVLQTGLIGLCIYANIFRVALKDCWRERGSMCSLIIAAVLLGYMVCGISEVYSQFWLFIILTLGYCVEAISGGGY